VNSSSRLSFTVEHCDGEARCGMLVTARGVHVATPTFMPVGTQATVKSLSPEEVASTGSRLILGNTYHLSLRPGSNVVQRLGGLHRFMNWPHAILTDSGGFQVFSLADLRSLDDEGVTFRSHIDGSLHQLTPETAMRIQAELGSDIAMVLDECPPYTEDRALIMRAMDRSTLWAKRSLNFESPPFQARFPIVQGGCFEDLRLMHLQALAELPADGLALGGFSVGEPMERMHALLPRLVPQMPPAKPRYLMGVGTPSDVLRGIAAGLDMFDCVLPTRNARNGQALSFHGRINLRQARHRDDSTPLDEDCDCMTCRNFSRAYLRHLFIAKEMLGPRLVTLHNLHFFGALMREARRAIHDNRYLGFFNECETAMREGDEITKDAAT